MSIRINTVLKTSTPASEKTQRSPQAQQEIRSTPAPAPEQQTVSLHPRSVAGVQASVDARTEEVQWQGPRFDQTGLLSAHLLIEGARARRGGRSVHVHPG